MVARGLSPALLGLVLSACFDLTKVDPGPRYVDDFDHGNLTPSWTAFGKWQCGTFIGDLMAATATRAAAGSDLRVGQDDGADGGTQSDPDGSVSCQPAQPGVNDLYALAATFELNEPLDAGQQLGAAVVTRTQPGTTVDVTGFTQLWFSAYFDSAPALPQVPAGTQLQVELGCSNKKSDPLAFQKVPEAQLGAGGWPMFQGYLDLDLFRLTQTAKNRDCLSQVDSIHFTVIPMLTSGTSTTGTLHLDNINLQ